MPSKSLSNFDEDFDLADTISCIKIPVKIKVIIKSNIFFMMPIMISALQLIAFLLMRFVHPLPNQINYQLNSVKD